MTTRHTWRNTFFSKNLDFSGQGDQGIGTFDISGLALLCQKRPLVSPCYARRVSHADHEQMEVLIP